ncbi:hypothetical protein CHS0354_002139 [Potamilus streckersoni]|uniref:Uncharacterized protein n=1 Tax=Potamilus streckersoni TaxID=2493646 RepID=A0AAE0RS35_9BIVA|nr:hypothetical protein CHS0354_002139 [Potamilus streckersoni]
MNSNKVTDYQKQFRSNDSNDDGAIDGTQKRSISERMAFVEFCLKNSYDFRCQHKKWATKDVVEI